MLPTSLHLATFLLSRPPDPRFNDGGSGDGSEKRLPPFLRLIIDLRVRGRKG